MIYLSILIKNINALIRKSKGKYSLENCDICIENGIIVSLHGIAEGFIADKVINGEDKLAIPGLINCHTHTYMTCFRCLADDVPFTRWLFECVMPKEDRLTNEDAYYSSMSGCAEMIKTGTTAFLEMHMFKGMVAKACIDSGMRGVLSRGLVGKGDNEAGRIRLEQAFDEMKEFAEYGILTYALAPHAIYTCDDAFLCKVSAIAKEKHCTIHTHLSESVTEFTDCIEQNGKTPTEYLESIGLLDNKVIAAHCTNITDKDIEILAKHNINVVLCIRSNMKLGNGIPQIKKMLDAGINLCLGTDSAASNNTLNLFAEMTAASLISKGVERLSDCVTAGEVLDMATYNAAKALDINSGELAVGKNADITILDLNTPAFTPRNDLLSALCYSANGSEAETVIINGEVVMENKVLTRFNEKTVYDKTSKIIERLEKNE